MKKRHLRDKSCQHKRKQARSRVFQFESLEPRYVLDASVVINEIMYHPNPVTGSESDYEWVELFNEMSINMDISGWRLEGAIQYTFAEDTVIPGRGYMVIASNPSALASAGIIATASGPFTDRLNNSGDEVILVNRDGRRMSVVDYDDEGEWSVGPDGSGFSLAKLDQYSDSSNPASWRASRQINGTPGAANFPIGTDPGPALVFNEIPAASASEFWVEIANQGTSSIDLSGYQITTSAGAGTTYTFASQTIGAGQILLIDQATLGFGATSGDKLFFFSPGKDRLIDAREVTNSVRGLEASHGSDWLHPATATPGAANSFQLNTDIVINEIMYHAIPNYPVSDASSVTTLVGINATTQWRYKQSAGGLATNWAQTAHPVNGTTWFQGPGVLGVDPSPPVVLSSYPIRTTLNSPGSVVTTYYETDFTFSGNLSEVDTIKLGFIIDDGAIFYLNGVEIYRYNMPSSGVTSSTPATNGIEASYIGPVVVPKTALVVGSNRLSVEVHQVAGTTDVLMGAELFAIAPTITFSESPEEWVELYNKGAAAVDLSGWKFVDGINYTIPNGTIIPAGGYLVIAKDQAALKTKYPLIATKIIGDFSGSLSNSTDNIALIDNFENPVDSVRYYGSANWHESADGGGSTLELRSPFMDNSKAAAWGPSIESGKSDWNTYTYTGVATDDNGPDNLWYEFLFGFIESGEMLIDDVTVISNPGTGSATQLIQNGSFESDAIGAVPLKWRIIGNHKGTVIADGTNKVLRLVATGRTDHEGNNAGTTLAGGATIPLGTTYQISFKAKWISGSPQINSRLYFNRVSDTIAVEVPHNNGTPAAQNSNFVANAGPTYSELKHGPVLPTANQPVTISVRAEDPNGMHPTTPMTLYYSVEGGAFTTLPMTLGANGLYTGTIPGRPAGNSVQFYVQGQDVLGATSTFPAAGPNSRAMYEVFEGTSSVVPTTPIELIRIVARPADAANMLVNTNIMSNQNIGATIIYNNSEVFYDVGIRLKGSSASRGNSQWGGSYSIEFNPDQLFRGVYDEIALDSSGRGAGAPSTTGQQQTQLLVNQIVNAAGLGMGSNYDDLVFVVSPNTAHTGIDALQLARYNDGYLDETYSNGSDSNLYEYELVYHSTSTTNGNPESPKIQPNGGYVDTLPYDQGDDPDSYRWNNILKNNRDEQDFGPIIALNKAIGLVDDNEYVETMSELIDVDQWLRTYAAATAMGVLDTFARADNYHNIVFYVRPSDNKIVMLPWDWDEAFRATSTSTIHPGAGGPLRRLLTYTNDHVYFSHLYDIATHEFTSAYMDEWVDHIGNMGVQGQAFKDNHKAYIAARSASIISQIEALVSPSTPFNITSNGGNPMFVTTPTVTLNGTGYVDFHTIRVRGTSTPLNLTWSTYTNWQAVVPLDFDVNNLILDAYDVRGNLVHSDSITVTTSANTATPLNSLRITELNYHPANPPAGSAITDSEEYEFIELTNIGNNSINLANSAFTTGITFTFPAMSLAPGQHIVLVKNPDAFVARYGSSIPITGVYSGSLNNAGERLVLVNASGQTIHDFTFQDDNWIPAADGQGFSMVVVDTTATTSAWGTQAGWRRSAHINGSPGVADPSLVVGDYTFDDVVNAADYVMWRDTLGSTTNLQANGYDLDEVIDEADRDVWVANFGEPAGGAGASATGFAAASSEGNAASAYDAAFALLDGPRSPVTTRISRDSGDSPTISDNDSLLLLATSFAESDQCGTDTKTFRRMGEKSSDKEGDDSELIRVGDLLAEWRFARLPSLRK